MRNFSKMLSITAALMALLMLFASCSDTKTETDETTAAAQTQAVTEETTPAEQTEALPALEAKDYGDYEFVILWPKSAADGHFMHDEIYAEQTDGDVITSAVFTRNSRVEEAYNITIKSVNTESFSSIPGLAQKASKSGDQIYDAYCTTIAQSTSPCISGYVQDFSKSQYFTEDSTWWDHDVMNDFAIGGHLFLGSGDVIYSDNFYPLSVFCNLEKFDEYKFGEDIYSVVRNKQWTLDKLMEYCAAVPVSTDDTWDYNDTYGMLLHSSFAKAMFYSAGNSIATVDAEGNASINITVENTQGIIEKMVDVFHNGKRVYDTDDDINHNIPGLSHAETAVKMFTSQQAVFYCEELITTERLANAGFESEYCVLPVPLYSADQEDYVCVLNDAVLISIPDGADLDRSVHILSAMSRESVDTLTPAFFEIVLKYRYLDSANAVEMLNIVLDSAKAPDIGTILNWGSLMSTVKSLVRDGNTDFASKYKTGIKSAETMIKSYNKQIAALD